VSRFGAVCCAAAFALAGVLSVSALALTGVLTFAGMLFLCLIGRRGISSLTDGCGGGTGAGRCGCVEGWCGPDKQSRDSGTDHESFHGVLHIKILLKDADCRIFQPDVILELKQGSGLQRVKNNLWQMAFLS
jgi:hypothetical protein